MIIIMGTMMVSLLLLVLIVTSVGSLLGKLGICRQLGLVHKNISPHKDGRKFIEVGGFVTDSEVKNGLLEISPTVATIKLNMFRRRE